MVVSGGNEGNKCGGGLTAAPRIDQQRRWSQISDHWIKQEIRSKEQGSAKGKRKRRFVSLVVEVSENVDLAAMPIRASQAIKDEKIIVLGFVI